MACDWKRLLACVGIGGLLQSPVGCNRHSVISLFAPQDRADAGVTASPRPDTPAPPAPENPPPAATPPTGSSDAGSPEESGPSAVDALRVRYDFGGSGTRLIDRVGSADGEVLGGAQLSGEGQLELDGQDDYVDLPNGLLSGLDAVTIMVWLEWAGGICWQRVFDFGSSDQGEDQVGDALTSLFLTPKACGRETAAVRIELDGAEFTMHMDAPLAEGQPLHVTVTIDPLADATCLYVDGELQVRGPAPLALARIDDVNVWLGRSQWVQDHHWAGRYDELRIYDRALGPNEIQGAFADGPDAPAGR